MSEEFSKLNDEESLKAENEFLKMKLMLERGAEFGNSTDANLPTDVENQFLNYIEEYERQFEQHKTISVNERLKTPKQFRPVAEIPDEEIGQAWAELSDYMNKHGISLDVCSPNVTVRELYRFTTEELLNQTMGDIRIPGMMTNFIYDEFYPDPIYDNSRMVEQDLFNDIFNKRDLFFEIHYCKEGFIFNGTFFSGRNQYIEKINRFKSLFSEIELTECKVDECKIENETCIVNGSYSAIAVAAEIETVYKGGFRVELEVNDIEYWDFSKIFIEGFDPQ